MLLYECQFYVLCLWHRWGRSPLLPPRNLFIYIIHLVDFILLWILSYYVTYFSNIHVVITINYDHIIMHRRVSHHVYIDHVRLSLFRAEFTHRPSETHRDSTTGLASLFPIRMRNNSNTHVQLRNTDIDYYSPTTTASYSVSSRSLIMTFNIHASTVPTLMGLYSSNPYQV